MVYEKTVPSDDEGEYGGYDDDEYFDLDGEYGLSSASASDDQDHAVVVLDSPLSSNPDDTRLEVEVVGIYTDSSSSNNNADADADSKGTAASLGPSMAMVVVKKAASDNGKTSSSGMGNNLMLQNLFQDSETKILRELEKGLDGYESGKTGDWSSSQTRAKAEPLTMGETKMGHGALSSGPSKPKRDDYFDAEIIDVPSSTTSSSSTSSPEGNKVNDGASGQKKEVKVEEDFAVRAARQAAAAAAKNAKEGDAGQQQEDFAVSAATAAAAARKEKEDRIKAERSARLREIAAVEATAGAEAEATKMETTASASPMSTKTDAVTSSAAGGGGKAKKKKRKKVKRAKRRKVAAAADDNGAAKYGDAFASTALQAAHPDATDFLDVDPTRVTASRLGSSGGDNMAKFRMTVSRSRRNLTKASRDKAEEEARAAAMQERAKAEKHAERASESGGGRRNGRTDPRATAKADVVGPKDAREGPKVEVEKGEDYAVAAATARRAARTSTVADAVEASNLPDNTDAEKDGSSEPGGEGESGDNVGSSAGAKKRALATNRKINILRDDPSSSSSEKEGAPKVPDDVVLDSLRDKLPSKNAAANDALSEAVGFMPDGESLTPDELLQNVMEFGEKMEEEEKAGAGFASGAFEAGRELLREEADRKAKAAATEFKEPEAQRAMGSEEEELRRIFEAGERLAESGGGAIAAPDATEDVVTDKYVDDLIASDPTVPNNARSLDDELAELEMRISRSPDEGADGYRGPTSAGFDPYRPSYDVMSGPEAYDPNVVAGDGVAEEDAVNWPGAAAGTRTDLRGKLPRELEEAAKQARFAADAMARMRAERSDDGDGDEENGTVRYFIGDREITPQQAEDVARLANEAVQIGLVDDPFVLGEERSRLSVLVNELRSQPEERFEEIASNYRDVLLSDNFVRLMRERLDDMARRDVEARRRNEDVADLEERHAEERAVSAKLANYAQVLLKRARALGAELEASHLEVVRSICKVAMDPSHGTEEETAAALTDAVRDMRPMFDESFVAYLKHAIAEEEGRLAREGVLDDPERNRWLFVLKIVQGGVYKELAVSVNRLIEHVWYVLRMETKSERRMMLEELVDVMPTMDVRPFVNVVENIAGALGEASRGEFADGAESLGGLTNRILQLRRDVSEVLPPDRIKEMSRDADEWAAGQRKRLMEARQETKKRLQNARETEEYDPDQPGKGEMERIT